MERMERKSITMHVLMELLVIFMLATSAYAVSSNIEEASLQDRLILGHKLLGAGREKRFLFTLWRHIMRDTRFLMEFGKLKIYEKTGGLKQALKDFDMLNPTDVKETIGWAKSGHVGDLFVRLKADNDGIPSLYISNLDKEKVRKILYMK